MELTRFCEHLSVIEDGESVFASLECELIDRRSFKTKTEARLAVFTWIGAWYNPRRPVRGWRHASRGQPCTGARHHLRINSSTVSGSGATPHPLSKTVTVPNAKLNRSYAVKAAVQAKGRAIAGWLIHARHPG